MRGTRRTTLQGEVRQRMRSDRRSGTALVSTIALWAIMVSTPAQALSEQDLRNCDSLQAELSIPACTVLIDEPRLPDSVKALARLKRGLAYFSVQKFDEALVDFDAARKLNPKDHIAHNEL